jgi:hypothetical protein
LSHQSGKYPEDEWDFECGYSDEIFEAFKVSDAKGGTHSLNYESSPIELSRNEIEIFKLLENALI